MPRDAHPAMLTLRTLVFPTDGSDCSEAARNLAEQLAARHGAHLHVLRVEIVTPEMNVWQSRAAIPEDTRTVDGVTEARRLFPLADVAIVDYAEAVGADLIVMGTHGRSGLSRLALGSTAEGVLRRATCPVLTVGPDAATTTGPVLAPVAFEASSDAALAAAGAFAEALGTHVVALHVVEPIAFPVPYAMTWEPFDHATLVGPAQETLGRWTEPLAERGVIVEPVVRQGHAASEIVELARERGASLLVQATHGRRGPSRWLLGSVAEDVVRRAPCPVLTLRPGMTPLVRDRDSELLPVAHALWAEVFDALARRAADESHRVSVVCTTPDRVETLYDNAPLVGLTYDARADAVQVMTAHGSHTIARPAALRATAGPWTSHTARDPSASGPWTVEVVRGDGRRERIVVVRGVAEGTALPAA